jgi:hypothetical protein
MSPQISGLVSSRDRSLRYLLIACGLVIATISMLVSIKVSAATVWSGVAASKVTINPARKGDRLPLVLGSDPNPANRPIEVNVPRRAVQHSLPDGCEALASHLARSTAAHIAGRCVS